MVSSFEEIIIQDETEGSGYQMTTQSSFMFRNVFTGGFQDVLYLGLAVVRFFKEALNSIDHPDIFLLKKNKTQKTVA